MMMTLLSMLLACHPPTTGDSDTGPLAPDDSASDVEDIGDYPDPAEALFGMDTVAAVDLFLDASALASLNADPYAWVQGAIAIDGQRIEDVGIHLKGRIGSFRDLSGKAAFRVDFNHYLDQRFAGLEGLTLNNMLNDFAQVHEITAYPFYEQLGVAAPRVGYAWVTVNGQDYGLYANVETPDDRWLRRVYDEPDGNLYEATYFWYDDGSYTLVDFDYTTYTGFELDEGQDVGRADLLAVIDAVQSTAGTEAFYETVGQVLDWQQFFRLLATEVWVGQWDGYNYNSNNYKVYFNPQTGLAEVLPWGHDWCFMDWATWSSPWTLLGANCLAHAQCKADYRTALREVLAEAEAWPFQDRIQQAITLIEPYMLADPRKEQTVATIHDYQDDVLDWVEDRSQEVGAAFGVLDPIISVQNVAAGSVDLLQSEDDLALDHTLVAAYNYGGGDVTVAGVPFTGQSTPWSIYAGNVPVFDDDPSAWTGLETVAYSSMYSSPGVDMTYDLPVTAGVPLTLQLLFFEVYYSGQDNRKVHVLVEGQQVVTNLDTHTQSDTAGLVYTLALTPTDNTLNITLRGSEQADGYPIINGLLLVAD